MTIGPTKIITLTCLGCNNLTREFDWHEGWYDCYCKDIHIGCFCPGEDIWPNTHQNQSEYNCPVVVE